MKLSDTEERMLAGLRRREASRLRWRCLVAIGALTWLGIGGATLLAALHFLREPDLGAALMLSWLIPMTLGSTAVGVGCAVWLFMRWNGSTETMLLLKLVEESKKHDD